MNVRQNTILTLLICSLSAAVVAQESSDNNANFSDLIDDGSIDFSLRYRYEFVDDDAFAKDAKASTLRTRLALQSGDYRGFDVFVELDDVRELFVDDFNAGQGNTPSRVQYPVVADPEGTEINQAYIDYSGFQDISLRLGRQRINFDNQRFIGGVGWRQNEQTYEGVNIEYSTDVVTANYVYVSRVRRIFGDDVPAGKHDQDGTHLVHVSGQLSDLGNYSGYYYLIDNEDAAAASTGTIGARLSGKRAFNDELSGRYLIEYARQSDAADNPVDYSANYWNLDVGLLMGIYDIGFGWEVLSGDANSSSNEAFRTPFATLHAFNGWADKFLGTPAAGLDDKYIKLKASSGPFRVQLHYHKFDTEDGSSRIGDEIDFQIGYKFTDQVQADAFIAKFDGSGGVTDTEKLFLQVSFNL